MNPVEPEQLGDRNNQLENKHCFFAIKALIGTLGWLRQARAKRDGEEQKNNLFTDKSEIHRNAREE